MRSGRLARVIAFAMLTWIVSAQQIELRPAPRLTFPSGVDSNSPALWHDDQLVVFNSTGMGPIRSSGRNQLNLAEPEPVVLGQSNHRPYWIEATWKDEDGTVFAWYHHEPPNICPGLTVPKIGALVSYDGGRSFIDLGIVLESWYPSDCSSPNGYFAGGHGDFTVMLDREGANFYFLFGNYSGPLESQGVAVARMAFSDRYSPIGTVMKYFNAEWSEPGIGGRVTPVFPAAVSWQSPDTDSFWGPSVHWNTYLRKYVMLLNHACCKPDWPQEGIYASFNASLSDPAGWSTPVKIMEQGHWYPQVIGRAPYGTDKLAGRVARFYIFGFSEWEIIFSRTPDVSAPPEVGGPVTYPMEVREPSLRQPLQEQQ